MGCSKASLCLLGWADGERRAVHQKSANNKAGIKTALLDFDRADLFSFVDFISVAYSLIRAFLKRFRNLYS